MKLMKTKIYFCILSLLSLLFGPYYFVHAQTPQSSVQIISHEFLPDGTRLEIIIEEIEMVNMLYNVSSLNSKTGKKTLNRYSGDTLLWSITVTGSFTYGNGTSKATTSSVSTTTHSSTWVVDNKKSWVSGNTAFASARGRLYFGPVVIKTIISEISLSCSPTGVLS